MLKLFVACLLIFPLCCGQDELLSLVVVFRHGARTPIDPYTNDPYKNLSYWPVGYGQLTSAGAKQQFELGQWLRKRYTDFIPRKYREEDVYVLSTDVDRTLMSAEAHLAGLFPPTEDFYLNISWQPIPVHSREEANDEVLAMKKPCPRYTKLQNELTQTPYFQELMNTYQQLFTDLTRYTGDETDSIDKVEYIYDTLTLEKDFNYSLPPWTRKVYPDKMKYLSLLSFAMPTYTADLARLKVGPFFNLLTEHFRNVSSKNNSDNTIWSRKLLIFSGHDTTIASILNSMQVFDLQFPPFASAILFELRRSTNGTYINLFFKNSTKAVKLRLRECQLNCDFEKFKTIVEYITLNPTAWSEECTIYWFDFLPFGYQGNLVAITMFSSFVLIVLCLFCAMNCLKNKKAKSVFYEQLSSEET